jgi:hypothetical protein
MDGKLLKLTGASGTSAEITASTLESKLSPTEFRAYTLKL